MSEAARAMRLRMLGALACGALLACAFAPLGLWPLGFLCPAVLMALWRGATPRAAAQLGFCFSAGMPMRVRKMPARGRKRATHQPTSA